MGLDRNALDRWITGGRYSAAPGWVTCKSCNERSAVLAETEYGATTWSPEECPKCGAEFSGDETWEDDEPPEATDEEIDRSFDAYR